MPLPTCTMPTTTSQEFDAKHSGVLRVLSWEEPHPGRRLSYPNDTPTSWGSHAGAAVRRGGMTAEGQWHAHAADSSSASLIPNGRKGRGRTRNVPQQLVLADAVQSRPEIQTAPLPNFVVQQSFGGIRQTQDAQRRQSLILGNDHAFHDPNADMSGTDSDTDSSVSAPPRKRMALEPLTTSFHGFHFSNAPSKFGVSLTVDETDHQVFSAACSDAAAFSVMSPDDDMYGWDAILERKTTQPSYDMSTPVQHRRASRSKRSLLQRVFSPGGSEAPDNPPTSFAGLDFFEPERH